VVAMRGNVETARNRAEKPAEVIGVAGHFCP
jgi:hypothetical protein